MTLQTKNVVKAEITGVAYSHQSGDGQSGKHIIRKLPAIANTPPRAVFLHNNRHDSPAVALRVFPVAAI